MTANSNRPTIPSSLADTKPAVEVQPASPNGQMVTAARIDLVTVGQLPQQQPTNAGGFPFLPLIGIAAAIAAVTLGVAAVMPQIFSSKVEALQAELRTTERRLERAESAQTELNRIRECIGQ